MALQLKWRGSLHPLVRKNSLPPSLILIFFLWGGTWAGSVSLLACEERLRRRRPRRCRSSRPVDRAVSSELPLRSTLQSSLGFRPAHHRAHDGLGRADSDRQRDSAAQKTVRATASLAPAPLPRARPPPPPHVQSPTATPTTVPAPAPAHTHRQLWRGGAGTRR